MQIDAELAAVIGVVSSVVSYGIGYGVMKEKVRQLEEKVKQAEDRVVAKATFDATLPPIQDSLREVHGDIKKILIMLTRRSHKDED